MKAILTSILLCAVTLTASAQSSTPIRCKADTRWGQCTNEAVTSDSLCTLHCQQSKPLPATLTSSTTSSRTTTTVIPSTSTSRTSSSRTSSTRSTATYSGRCQARTKKGSQCSRTTSSGSRYCWQHSR